MPLDVAYANVGGGIKPTMETLEGAGGEKYHAIISKGGVELPNVNVLSVGPDLAKSEELKRKGEIAGGLAPTPATVTGPSGEAIPGVTAGGGGGAAPVFSPLLKAPPGSGMGLAPPAPTPAASAPATPAESAAEKKVAEAPLPETIVGPTIAAKGFMEATATLGKDILGEITANGHTLPQMAKRVDMLAKQLEEFQAGGLANARANVGSIIQGFKNMGFPISDELVQQVSNGNLSASQVFTSLISRAAVQSLKADAEGTGRVMRTEVDRYLDAIGASNDPAAIRVLLNNLRWNMAVGYDQSQKFTDFKNMIAEKDPKLGKYKDISDFSAWYNHNFDEKKMEMPPGMAVGEIPAGTFKGEKGKEKPPIESYFR